MRIKICNPIFAKSKNYNYLCKPIPQIQICKMELVSRLKTFIDHLAIPVTQFADNCGIPRPSFSQLLNGRNKKVSDEVISKIHDAYPELSVMWLMFGEGDMLYTQNIKTSEPQNDGIFSFSNEQLPIHQQLISDFSLKNIDSSGESEKFHASEKNIPEVASAPIEFKVPKVDGESTDSRSTISFEPYAKKKIVNIIVYYDDNSFESFVPGIAK